MCLLAAFLMCAFSSQEMWRQYVIRELHAMAGVARKGFAFNMLTIYADPERMRNDLFYADPAFFFDYCKRNIGPRVALLHDYPLYEFTLLIYKD